MLLLQAASLFPGAQPLDGVGSTELRGRPDATPRWYASVAERQTLPS